MEYPKKVFSISLAAFSYSFSEVILLHLFFSCPHRHSRRPHFCMYSYCLYLHHHYPIHSHHIYQFHCPVITDYYIYRFAASIETIRLIFVHSPVFIMFMLCLICSKSLLHFFIFHSLFLS